MANEIEIRVTSSNQSRTGFAGVERDASRMGQVVRRETGRAFNDMVGEARRAGRSMATTVEDSFGDMAEEARRGSERISRNVETAFSEMVGEARRSGQQAGRQLARELNDELDRVRGDAEQAGRDAGEGFGDGAQDTGRGRMRGVASSMAGALRAAPWLAVGAAIGALVVEGVKGAMEQETATATLKAQLGEFGPEGERLGRIAGELFRDAYGESIGEVNEAIRSVRVNIAEMATASDAELKTVTKAVLSLAEAFNEDVGQTARAVGKMVKTGLADDATHAANILTRAFQRGANEADDLLDTVSEYSTQFRSLGLSGEKALGLIVQGLRAGARDADVVADTIKEFAIEAVAGGDRVRAGFESLGLDADAMVAKFAKGGPTAAAAFDQVLDRLRGVKDEAKRNEIAIELFGTKAEDMAEALYSLDPSAATAALGEVGGAAKEMGDTLQETSEKRLEGFKRSLKGALVDFIGGDLLGGVEKFAEEAREIFTEWAEDNQDAVEAVQEVWDKLSETWDEIFSDVQEFVSENRDTIEEWGDKLGEIVEDAAGAVSAGLDIILGLWEKFGPTLMEVATILADTLLGWWGGLWETVRGIYETIAGLLTGDWERFWNGLKKIASGLGDSLLSAIKGLLRLIAATFRGTWRLIRGIVTDAFDKIRDTASKALSWVLGKVDSFWERTKKAFRSGVNAVERIFDDIRSATRKPVNFVVDVVYNRGIRRVWNFVAGIAGMDKLDWLSFQTGGVVDMRRGGVAPGYSAQDNRIGLFRDGEGVLVPEAVQSLGERFIHAANRAGHRARDLLFGGDPGTPTGRIPGFRAGGIVGAIKNAISSGVDILKGAPKLVVDKGIVEWAKRLLEPGRGDAGGAGWWGQAFRRIPPRMINEFLGWVKDNLADLFLGGGDFGKALAWARNQAGKPYIWGGVGPTGYDCCIIGTVRIYGPNGAKPIKEVRAGDRVFTYVDGRLEVHTVTAAWQSKHQPVFAVRTRNRTVTASANHPFLRVVMTEPSRPVKGGRRGEQTPARYGVEWARLDELKRGDLLVQPRAMATDITQDPALPDGTPVDTDVAWLLGAMVGDGTVTDKGLRLCLFGDKRDRATQIIHQRWGVNPTYGESYGLVVSCLRLTRALTAMGMRKRGPDKRVPDAVWTWEPELQRAFLDGYCDADGHRPADPKRHGERTYGSAAEELIEDVRALHIILGDAVSNISVTKRTKPITIRGKVVKNARPQYGFTVWGRRGRGEAVLRRRPGLAEWLDKGDFTLAPVLAVEPKGEQDTWDLEVEGAHNFVADGVVVHNSGFMSAIVNVLRGENPHRRLFTTFSFSPGRGVAGFVPGARSGFEVGVTNAGVGHMAGTLNGVNVESRGSSGVVVGPAARGAKNSMFTMRFGWRGKADNGAILEPGWNEPLYNGLGVPEELRPVDQIPEVHVHLHLENHGVLGSQIDVQDWLTRALDDLKRQGRLAALVQEARGTR